MIERTDLQAINTEYFDIVGLKEYSLVLRSKNTGHYWYLLEQEYNSCRTFLIHHKHHAADAYHPQKNRPTIEACCEYIMSHDVLHLERTRRKAERRLLRHSTRAGRAPRYFSIEILDSDPLSSSLRRGDAYRATASLPYPRRALDHHGEG